VNRRREFTSLGVTMLPPWGGVIQFDFQPRTPQDAIISVLRFSGSDSAVRARWLPVEAMP